VTATPRLSTAEKKALQHPGNERPQGTPVCICPWFLQMLCNACA
jgi:hypothetical protein